MMYGRMKNIGIKRYFLFLIIMLVLTNVSILLDVPFLRQILGFTFFTIFPGILILHILKLDEIPFLEKFVLSVGLSVAFLMFGGLLINSFYPIVPKPLSLFPLLTSFDIILLVLMFIAYQRNKYDFNIRHIFNYDFNLKSKLTSPLVFPIIFPFMAIYGTYLMNTWGNNIILMIMLLLIPIYIVAIVLLRNKIHSTTYPVAILMIVMGLVLMRGLTSNYITGTDIHNEYYTFRMTSTNSHWDISNYDSVLNALLSVTILPTIYGYILNSDMYIFKLYYPLIFSMVPICLYILFKKYTTELYAFLASIFFLSQFSLFSMVDHARQAIAMLYFSLTIMVFFDDKLSTTHKKMLILIFALAMIVSHYTTTYIFIALILAVWTMSILTKVKLRYNVTTSTVYFLFVSVFFWYDQLTNSIFGDIVKFGKNTMMNMYGFFMNGMRDKGTLLIFGKGVNRTADMVSVITHDISFVFIIIGFFSVIVAYLRRKDIKFGMEYVVMIIVSLMFWISSVVLPYVSYGYGIDRVYFQTLVILSPMFIVGGESIAKLIRPKSFQRLSMLIITTVLILQFLSGSYMVYQILGINHSIDLSKNGDLGSIFYIYDQEVIAGKWLNNFSQYNSTIYTDDVGIYRLMLGYDIKNKPNFVRDFFSDNETVYDGYTYLRYTNVVDNKVRLYDKETNLENYSKLFIGKNDVYSNGGAKIYKNGKDVI